MKLPSNEEPLDPRSTQRKRARKVLFFHEVPFVCGAPHFRPEGTWCRQSPKELPKDAPDTVELAIPENRTLTSTLQANHISKNIMDNDLANLEWSCPSCHKKEDGKTAKGVSQKGDNPHGYEI